MAPRTDRIPTICWVSSTLSTLEDSDPSAGIEEELRALKKAYDEMFRDLQRQRLRVQQQETSSVSTVSKFEFLKY